MKVFVKFILLGFFCFFLVLNAYSIMPQNSKEDSVTAHKIDSLLIQLQNLYKENFDSAQVYSKELLIKIRQIGDSVDVAEVYNTKAIGLAMQGNYEASILMIQKAIPIIDSASNSKLLAQLYNNYGRSLKGLQRNKKAMDFYLRGLKINEITRDTLEIISSLANIGGLHSSMKKHELSLKYTLEALELAEPKGNLRMLSAINNNIAIAYKKLGDLESALTYYRKALHYYNQMQWSYGQAYVYGNIGVLQETLDPKGDSALYYYNKALAIHESVNDSYGIGITKINMALIYNIQRKLVKAQKLFNESIKIANEINSSQLLEFAYDGLSDLEKIKGNYKQAFEYYKLNREIVDSVYNAEKHQQIAELEAKYQTERKNREIEILSKNAEIQELQLKEQKQEVRNARLIIIGLIVFVLLGITLAYFVLKLNKTRHVNDKNILEIKNLRTEQKMLKSQMNPHFVFNALNSIQAFITSNQTELASKYLANFAKLIRGFLENARSDQVLLVKEIELLKVYIELEQVRFDQKFDYDIFIDDEVEDEFISIPPLVIQPFVENAILHAFRNRSKGKIDINFKMENEYLICEVDDDGIGREKAQTMKMGSKRESLALKITQRRLESINEQYNVKAGFEIIDKKDQETNESLGTKVVLKLPVID
jgi:tetratricopeptide (TPR) repeat protein